MKPWFWPAVVLAIGVGWATRGIVRQWAEKHPKSAKILFWVGPVMMLIGLLLILFGK